MIAPQGPKVEASTLSRSTSQVVDAAQRKEIINGKVSLIDRLFPLSDEILKTTKIPEGFFLLLCMFVSVQMLCVSYWSQFPDYFDYSKGVDGVLKYFFMITFFCDLSDSDTSLSIRFGITTGFTVICFGMLIFQLASFAKTRRFVKWTLYITRFLFEFVPIACMIPLGNFVGQSLHVILNTGSTLSIVYFVMGIIYLGLFMFAHYLQSFLWARSTYITNSPVSCWSGFVNFIFPVGVGFSALLSWVVQAFTSWMMVVLLVGRILFDIFICYQSTFLPFIQYNTNTLLAILFTTQMALNVLGVIKFWVKFDAMYCVIVMVVVIIGSAIGWSRVTAAILKKVKSRLHPSALEGIEATSDAMPSNNQGGDQYMVLQDPQKRQLYLDCGIHRSAKRAELYLRIGLTNCCPLFYDWSLAKFVSEYYSNDADLICLITQYLSYFPCESRLLNYFFILSVQKSGLKVGDRFMLYQVHRVKGLRQSSASSEITDKLMEMKGLAQRGMTAVRNFWEQVPRNPSILYDIRHSTTSTTSLFNESLSKWPNNCRLVEDFSAFLIECAADFSEGLKMKHRAELIEQGKNFVVDLPFRSLVRCYPMYLKKGIMDVKGNFLNRGASTGTRQRGNASLSGSSNSSNSQVSSSVLNGELDAEVEDQLGRLCFSQHKLRLAYQRALDGRKSANNQRLKVMSAIAMITAAGLIIFLFAYFYNKFQVRAENMERQGLLNQFRYGFDAAVVTIVTHWARKTGLISDELFGDATVGLAMRSPKTNLHNLQFNNITHLATQEQLDGFNMTQEDYCMFDETQKWIMSSKSNLEDFASNMVLLASTGTNVHEMMEVMVDRVVTIKFCDGDWGADDPDPYIKPTAAEVNETLKTALTYGLIELANLSQNKFVEARGVYNIDKGLCECMTNVESMYDAFDALTQSLTEHQSMLRLEVTTSNWILMGSLCGAYLVVIAPFLFAFLALTLAELKRILKMMSDLDKETREQAAKPFKQSSNNDQEALNETKGDSSISPLFLYGNVIFFLVMVMFVFIIVIVMAEIRNNGFLELNQWLFYGISRGNYMLEAVCFAILDILLVEDPTRTQMITYEECSTLARSILRQLVESNTKVLRGSADEGLPACIGENAELDKLHFEDDCHDAANTSTFHDTYSCAALDRGINLFDVLITEILDRPADVKLKPDSTFYHAFHLMNCHLMDNTYFAATILTELASNSIAEFQVLISGFAFGGIVVLLLAYAIFIWNLQNLDIAFEGAIQLLKRLPPLAVVSNQSLLNYLLNKKSDKSQGKMTASKAVIYNAQDAVICLSRAESIEVVNKTVATMFGYTPEQLLGQSISAICQMEENKVLYEQMELMRNGEAALTYECHLIGRTDDDQTIPCMVTLLGIKDEKSKSAQSFVVIMRDETFSLKKKEEAEQAKKKSEELLYQILPRDIVVRLNQGETDISFVVPSASVIFVDIVKFSDYAATLTPAQIMENLSKVFAAFDNCCAKQNLMTKIKLIGDVYMAAANLFTPDEPPSAHASQVIQFGLDCLSALEEVNTQLDANLSVRIGVNTDGPLIAGVLGTDKPVFDIIGDTINVSSRLQSTCIPGTVQISQTTFDAVSGMNFNIEQRGEIFLKGKGKRMAYVVRPNESSSFFVSADSSQAALPPLS